MTNAQTPCEQVAAACAPRSPAIAKDIHCGLQRGLWLLKLRHITRRPWTAGSGEGTTHATSPALNAPAVCGKSSLCCMRDFSKALHACMDAITASKSS